MKPEALRSGPLTRSWMTRLPGLVVVVCFPFTLLAQGDKELRAKADALFAKGEYAQAFEPYQTLVSNNVQDFDLNYRYGVCAMYGGAEKDEAVKFLKRSTQAPTTPALAWYFLGKAYHLTYHFKDAILAYDKFQGTADKRTLSEYPVTALLLQCRNGQNLLSNLKEIDVHNKVEVDGADFFRFYDLSSIGGKLVVTPDELLSSLDKKDKERGLVYLPDKGGPIYFSSHGKNNETGRDIYRTELMPDGSFAVPQKLAGFINTPQDENYPFMSPDGKTFYFCSKGHNSMGGYDVFRSTYDKGMDVFGAPVNMDFAVNTPDDDVLYLTDPEGKEACFASARDSKQGMLHVYRVSTNQAPVNITVLKGTFASQFDEKDRKAHIVVTDALSQEQVADVRTDIDGSYVLSLPRSGRYKFTVEAGPSGKTHVGMVEVPRNDEPKVYRQEMSLIDQGGEKLMIKNYFDQPLEEDMIALALEEIKRRAKLDVGSHAVVAEAPVEEKKSGDVFTRAGFAGDMNRTTALETAQSDATALHETERSLDTQAKTAFSMALENMAKADAAARKAEDLVAKASTASDEAEKNQLMTDAARQRTAARNLSTRARAAYQAGQDLDGERTATALKAQKAAKLKEDLTAAFSKDDENAMVIRLVELRARMDEKNAPDGGLTAAEKMRRTATEREREAATLLLRANDSRSEESELADRVARKKREENEAKGSKKEALARERSELEGQLQAMREENDKAFNKARVAERAGIVARGQAELARKLTVVAGTIPITEVSTEQRDQLARRIGGVDDRMTALQVDERYDAAIAEEVREAERSMFDWGAADTGSQDASTASASTIVRDRTGDARSQQGNTITTERAGLSSAELNTAAVPTGNDQNATGANAARTDTSTQATQDNAAAQSATTTGSQDKEATIGKEGEIGSSEGSAQNTSAISSDVNRTADSGTRTGTSTTTGIATNSSTAGQGRETAPVSRTNEDPGANPAVNASGKEHPAQEEGALVNDGRSAESTATPTEPAPEEKAFVLSNELAELKQLRNAEKSRTKKDSLDQRIASVELQLRSTTLAAETGAATDAQHSRTGNSTAEDDRAGRSNSDAARTAFNFTDGTSEAIVLQHVFAGYQEKAQQVRSANPDKGAVAVQANALEQRLADSLDAESARQSAALAEHPERSGEILARIDRLRRIKENHLTEATRLMADAGQRYGAGETEAMEDAAIASQQNDQQDAFNVRTSQTPHNDEYILIDDNPEYIYTSSVTYRSSAARKETGQMDQHLDDLVFLETRIDSLEEVLLMMPEGKAKDKLRDRTDRLIDDRMIARTEIGQATGFYTREEFRTAQDSAKLLTGRTSGLGLPLTEPSLQLANDIESAAARDMAEAGKVRKRADRTEDIVLKDSLLRQAYAQELAAIRNMDRALTVRNYILDARYKRGEQVAYEEVERRMFGEISGPDVVAAQEEEGPSGKGTRNDSTLAALTRDPAGNERYKEFMGQDSGIAPVITKERLSESDPTLDPVALQARGQQLERASISTADQANRLQDSAAVAKRADRSRLEEEAARMRLRSDSLHRAAQLAEALASERAVANGEQAKKEELRKRLMRFYYLDEQEQEMVMNEGDRSHYFEARSMAIDQREQAATAKEQATTTKRLADVLLQQSADLLANTGSGQQVDTARSGQAQRIADQAVRLTHRSDSLNAHADRLLNAAKVNEAQAASILQGLEPDRGTDIMAMEQRARRVEPVLAQVRANDAVPSRSEPITAKVTASERPVADAAIETGSTSNTTNESAPSNAATASGSPNTNSANGSSVSQGTSAPPVDRAVPDLTTPLTSDDFSMNVPPAERLKEIPMDAPLPAGVVFKVQVGAFRSEVPAEVFSDMTPVTGEHVGNGVKRYTVGMFTSAQNAAKATEQVRERGFRDAFVVAYQDGKRVPLAQAMKAAQPIAASTAAVAETRPPVTARIEPVRTVLQVDTVGSADQEVLTKYPATAEQLMAQFAPAAEATAYYNDPKAAPARQVETVKGLFFTVQVGVYSKPTALDKLFNITPLNSERTETGKIRYTTGVFVDMEKARGRKDETVGLGVKDAFITAYLNGKRIPMRDARALISRFGNSVLVDPGILTR